MRIISGKLKGRTIDFSKNNITRPLKDSVKESIFNILKHSSELNIKVEKSNVLDLYSGFGSFGLECISRGANKVTFVEQDGKVSKVLINNLIKMSVVKDALVINSSIEHFLDIKTKNKFDIFFFDPPYSDKEYTNIIKRIRVEKIYSKEHIAIIHREKDSIDDIQNFFEPIIIKRYGKSKILFGKFI